MKRFYELLPKNVVSRIRNVIEFNNGASDTHVLGAAKDAPPLYRSPYRIAPGSQPQANIPSGPLDRVYDIKYYSRDVRRATDPTYVPVEASLLPAARARVLPPGLIEKPFASSPGTPNPAVARYDPSGLRSAMTTTQAAVDKELDRHRGTHYPTPSWVKDPSSAAWLAAAAKANGDGVPGRPVLKRLPRWSYTHCHEW